MKKKLLSIEHNSQTSNHPIPYQTQKNYNVLHFKTVQVTKSLQMSQVNSPRVERQIPDIGMTSCHEENYNLKSKIRSQRQRGKNKYSGEKSITEAMKLNDICIIFLKRISAFTSLKTLLS